MVMKISGIDNLDVGISDLALDFDVTHTDI